MDEFDVLVIPQIGSLRALRGKPELAKNSPDCSSRTLRHLPAVCLRYMCKPVRYVEACGGESYPACVGRTAHGLKDPIV